MILYDLKEIVRCKKCGQNEYWGNMTWLNGKALCRDCYSKAIENKGYNYPVEEILELCR